MADNPQQPQQPQPQPAPQANPHLQVPPDFAGAIFQEEREAMIQLGLRLDHAAAAQAMLDKWQAAIQVQREAWDALHPPPGAGAQPGENQVHPIKRLPKISKTARAPTRLDPVPPHAIINRLRDMQYVELYPFTPEACKEAAATPRANEGEDVSIVGSVSDGSLAIRAGKKYPSDFELTWDQFTAAKSLFIRYLTITGWPQPYRESLSGFFIRIENHPIIHKTHLGKAIMLRYQAVTRHNWTELVRTLELPEDPEAESDLWDIAQIQDHILADCIRHVENADAERLRQEVSSTPTRETSTLLTVSYPHHIFHLLSRYSAVFLSLTFPAPCPPCPALSASTCHPQCATRHHC